MAWNWLWDTILRMLRVQIGRPPVMCAALKPLIATLDKAAQASSGTTSVPRFHDGASMARQVQTVHHSIV